MHIEKYDCVSSFVNDGYSPMADLVCLFMQGRNEFAINVITQELGYLTWDEAFICLTNENLPDQLRAKYCSLIIGQLKCICDLLLTFSVSSVRDCSKVSLVCDENRLLE